MKLTIRVQGTEAPFHFRQRLETRLQVWAHRYGARLGRVTVHLVDLNGPRGGLDIRCRVVAAIPGQGQLVAEAIAQNAIAAADLAVDRLVRAMARATSPALRRTGARPTVIPGELQ
ncbi:MAG: HPF/RaiA family ribosome-associated protein [Anaeromyxobacteraceae bacterium]